MKKLFLLMALFGVLCAGCSEPNDPIDTPQDPTEQPGNDTGNGDEGNEDENGGNNDENEGNEDENKAFITDAEGNIIVNAEGGEVVVAVATNIDYDVVIPEDAQAWLSVADTRGELRMEKLTFTVAENYAEERSAVVTLLDSDKEELQIINIIQESAIISCATNEIIYTTKYGYPIELSVTTGFGGNVVSHTYENGHGKIVFDNDVQTIPSSAFKNCNSITTITLPESVTLIGEYAFYGCSSLTSVYYKGELSDWCNIDFYSGTSNPLYNGAKLYINNTEVTEVTIPSDISKIKNYAFYGCSSLTSITIPDSVTSIGRYAFEGCTGELIVNCNIPSASSSSYGAFYNSKFTKVTIGDSVTSIGDYAFYNCNSLTSVIIPKSVTSIGNSAFNGCTGELIVNCNIPSASSSSYGAFYNSKFTKVTIGDSVTSIGDYTFYNCSSLACITIPESVTSIGRSAFDGCTGELIVNCNIPSASDYDEGAFYSSKFTKVTIGDSITSIGDYAFYNCSSLTSITIPESVTTFGERAFDGCTGELIVNCNIPSASENKHGAFYSSKFTKVTIGDNVTSIGDYAFYGCSSLTSITIPDSVTKIGDSAFYGCSNLTSITIPDSVTTIGESVFKDCSNLKEFKGKFASEDKKCLIVNNEIVAFAPSEITEYTIPSNVISIGSYTFYNCSCLTSVTIPEYITSIGEYAFFDCRNLKSVYCKPTTPPSGNSKMFGNNAANLKIYVPIASKEAYLSAEDWVYYGQWSIVGYDFEIGRSEYDFKIDASVLAFVDRGYFSASDISEIPGCDLFNSDYYDDKIILPLEYQVNATIDGFCVSAYDWTNRTDEYDDTQYVESLVWYMNKYGNAAQKSYLVLDYYRSYTLVALLIDCNGQKYFSKTKIETSHDCINTNISVFETFWEENL